MKPQKWISNIDFIKLKGNNFLVKNQSVAPLENFIAKLLSDQKETPVEFEKTFRKNYRKLLVKL